jgi:hypothetical protein
VGAGVKIYGLTAKLPARFLVLAAVDGGRSESGKSDGSIARFSAALIR